MAWRVIAVATPFGFVEAAEGTTHFTLEERMEGRMRITEPIQYLPFINRKRADNDCRPISPDTTVECCGCPSVFPFRQGVVFQAKCDGEVVVGLFCSALCYVTAIPKEACGHA